jgi:DNA-binding NarL/FixJ family response regulator
MLHSLGMRESSRPSSVLVSADDQIRELLPTRLELFCGIRPLGVARSIEAATEEVDRSKPDIILIDQRLKSVDDVHACRELRRVSPASHLVILVNYVRRKDHVLSALAGASACLIKEPGAWNKLKEPIAAVARGERLWEEYLLSLVPRPLLLGSPFLTASQESLYIDLVRLKTNSDLYESRGLSDGELKQAIAGLMRLMLDE